MNMERRCLMALLDSLAYLFLMLIVILVVGIAFFIFMKELLYALFVEYAFITIPIVIILAAGMLKLWWLGILIAIIAFFGITISRVRSD